MTKDMEVAFYIIFFLFGWILMDGIIILIKIHKLKTKR